jgi:hypothetical protein
MMEAMRPSFLLLPALIATLFAAAPVQATPAGASPLLGVWRGDVVRVHEGAIIGRNVLTLRIGSARVGSTFAAELPRSPACTARFRISKRLTIPPRVWVAGIPRSPSGDGRQCVLAGFWDGYTKDAFKLTLLDGRRLRVTGLSFGVRVQATLTHPR